MRTEFGPREAARLGGVLFIASAVLSALVLAFPQPQGVDRGAILTLAGFSVVVGGLVYLMPWDRWPKRLPLALLPVAFTLIAFGNWFGSARSYSYSVFFVVAFVWIGITQPRWTSLPFAPLAAIAYVAPILLRPGNANTDAAAALLAIPVCVLVAEILAWVVAREQRSRRAAQTLARLASRVAHHLDESALCQALVDESKDALSSDHAVLFRVDETTRTLASVYTSGVNERMQEALRRMIGSKVDDLPAHLTSGQAIVVEDVPRGPERPDVDTARRFGVRSFIAIPVMARDNIAAVLSCWETTRHRRYTTHELSVADGLAGQASAAFQNAYLYEQTLAASRHDPLTALGNRRAFRERLSAEVERARRYGRDLSLVVLDADHFKTINDTEGHQAGDRALVQIADLLQVDRRMEDGAFRIGGDEFALVLPETGAQGATVLAERLRRHIEHASMRAGDVALTVSVGVSALGEHGSSVDELFERADAALYDVKANGGNAIALPRDDDASATARLGVDIDAIIDGDHLRAFYQPIFDVRSGEVMAFEAFCRLDPALGHTPTTTLLRAASATSRLVTFDQLCRAIAIRGARTIDNDVLLFVNVAPAALEADRFDPQQILDVLAAEGLQAERLVIEVSEVERTARSKALVGSLKSCRDAGINIALDDFGTGVSDLDLLAATRFDYVKVDLSFGHGTNGAGTRQRVLRALCLLATETGAKTIAKGIETLEDLAIVKELGFSGAQGFLLREPSPTLDHTPRRMRVLRPAGEADSA